MLGVRPGPVRPDTRPHLAASPLPNQIDRDRGAPRGAAPPTPPGIRVTYRGGSTGLSMGSGVQSGETGRVEIVIAQGHLHGGMAGHPPEPPSVNRRQPLPGTWARQDGAVL